MAGNDEEVVYWDAPAVLSVLFQDGHSAEAKLWVERKATHLMSTLTYAEVYATVYRLKRDRLVADVLIRATLETLDRGPWRRLNLVPDWSGLETLAERCGCRSNQLWHLATIVRLRDELPEIVLLTFERGLREAAARTDIRVVP